MIALMVGCGADSSTSQSNEDTSDVSLERSGQSDVDDHRQDGDQTDREDELDELDGAELAMRLIEEDRLVLREPPLPSPPWWNEYHRLLDEECGVEIEVVKMDGAGPALSDQDREFNRVMKEAIEAQFGEGIVGRLENQAMESVGR